MSDSSIIFHDDIDDCVTMVMVMVVVVTLVVWLEVLVYTHVYILWCVWCGRFSSPSHLEYARKRRACI